MIKAGVIGFPISHSRSPLIHGYWLRALGIDGLYERYAVAPDDLERFVASLRQQNLVGCNCTLPHKENVIRLVDEVAPAAAAIGAANTLWFEGDRLVADNTDAPGFLASFDADCPGWDKVLNSVVILGAGGAARGIVYALLSRGVERITLVNRSLERAEHLAAAFGPRMRTGAWEQLPDILRSADCLINTTSLGMKGQPVLELDLAVLPAHASVSDIVYIPLETDLIRTARQRGLAVSPGLGMLLHQAVPGFAHWFGQKPTVTSDLRSLIETDITKA